jgi:hypothetical protein
MAEVNNTYVSLIDLVDRRHRNSHAKSRRKYISLHVSERLLKNVNMKDETKSKIVERINNFINTKLEEEEILKINELVYVKGTDEYNFLLKDSESGVHYVFYTTSESKQPRVEITSNQTYISQLLSNQVELGIPSYSA